MKHTSLIKFAGVFLIVLLSISVRSFAQTCTPQPSGIVSWWRGEGNAADHRNAHNGTLQNGTSFAAGRVGQSFSFDGVNDAVDLGNWFDLQAYTIEMWVRSAGSQQEHADIIDNNHTDNRSWVLQYDNTGNQFHYAAAGSSGGIFFDLPPAEWHHIVITRDTNGATVGYKNNVVVGTATAVPIPYDGTQFLRLSNWGGGGRHFNGLIDEVTIYARALAPGRVAALFNAGGFGKCLAGNEARADFDGDGRTDLSVFRPSEGNWYLNRSTAGFAVIKWGISTDTLVPGDYDGDGTTDHAVFRPVVTLGVPDFYLLSSNGFTVSGYEWGVPGDTPVIGDYDGDNEADLAVFRSSENNWYVRRSSDGGARVDLFGTAGDIPLVMDYDSDGKDNLAVFRPGSNTWYMARSTGVPGQNFEAVPFGASGDKPVPADYDGDSATDVAVYRPASGTWYIRRSSNGAVDQIQFGNSTDIPGPGDYDGDGRDDIAIYRNGQWWINRSMSGLMVANFGIATDISVPKQYIP